MRQFEIDSQRGNLVGIRPKMSRTEKKRRIRLSKTERFIELLKKRGGYFKQKIEKEEKEREGSL